MPRNCEAEIRSGIASGGQGSPQGNQLFGFVVEVAGGQGGVHEGLKLGQWVTHLNLLVGVKIPTFRGRFFFQGDAKQISRQAPFFQAFDVQYLIPFG